MLFSFLSVAGCREVTDSTSSRLGSNIVFSPSQPHTALSSSIITSLHRPFQLIIGNSVKSSKFCTHAQSPSRRATAHHGTPTARPSTPFEKHARHWPAAAAAASIIRFRNCRRLFQLLSYHLRSTWSLHLRQTLTYRTETSDGSPTALITSASFHRSPSLEISIPLFHHSITVIGESEVFHLAALSIQPTSRLSWCCESMNSISLLLTP